MAIVQMSIRLEDDLRDQLKIKAITKGVKINDLLIGYLSDGLENDKDE